MSQTLAPLRHNLEGLDSAVATDSRRLFHGRGNCFLNYEHLVVDWFWPAIIVTFFSNKGEDSEADFLSYIRAKIDSSISVYVQRRYQTRPAYTHFCGPALDQLYARRGNLRFALQLENQNIGFFLDIEPARKWLEEQCRGAAVLNLFSYTCSFSLLASSVGAKSVLNMDLSSKSLGVGRQSYHASDVSLDGVTFFANDILKSWSRLKRFGPYDIVIVDPPSFQKGSFIADKDYIKVLRRLASFSTAKAKVLCCLNAPEVMFSAFKDLLDQHLDGFVFERRLEPSPDFPSKDLNRGLKMFVYSKADV